MCVIRQLRRQLQEMQDLQEASRNSNEKLQLAEQMHIRGEAGERNFTADDESQLIISNLRGEIRAMEAEVHEARRLKAHVK